MDSSLRKITEQITPAKQPYFLLNRTPYKTNKMKTSSLKLMLGIGALTTATAALAQPDYGPAIWHQAYAGHWYTSGHGHQFLVIHDMEGYYLSTISYIQGGGGPEKVSINYCVNGIKDNSSDSPAGEITQMVREANYAWHVGCWNTWMAGTEHEGFANNPAWYSEAMYQASAGLQRHMASAYGIPIDRNHIIAHGEWQNASWKTWMAANYPSIDTTCNSHTDPGIYWDWTHFMDLVSSTTNSHVNPALGINSDGRQEIFVVNKSGALTHSYQTTINGTWSGFVSLGGSYAQNCQPKVLRNNDGRLEVFAINSSGQLSHASEQTAGSSTSWSAFSTFSSSLTQQVKVGGGVNADGTLAVFVVGTDSTLYEMHQTTPGGSWSSWTGLSGTWSEDCDIANGNDLDGRQEVLLIDKTGHVNTFYQTAVNGSFSSSSASLGGTFAQNARMSMARNSDGRLEAFVIGSGGALYHAYQTAANGSWSSWTSLGGTGEADTQPVARANQNGSLEVIIVGSTGGVFHNHQTGTSTWAGWVSIGGTFAKNVRPALGINQDGRLEAYLVGSGSDMLRNAETSANSTTWASWTSIGGSFN
ncbi:N-acetylmuramyl-L-alanine amidase, negative regulator of AmpC, AmpD [Pedosphaera parvula Ellin514]|uniref:N-acetylmuramoyl-L-alanine amidase n=2 Tax=Pedosphaera TaxID=1032526 RepID=B9XPB1_PEDPL|nr:N-acetylmuramyl-L-alanine amidase, negative regulator of AmpC, AmpD [Pedosphaera parvula Ellin514]